MGKLTFAFLTYLLVTGGLVFFIVLTPVLAFQENPTANVLYDNAFAYICHQKISRSYCLFSDNSIGDCTQQNGIYREDLRSEKSTVMNGIVGYKFPVSVRDMLIYIGMFVGGIAVFAIGKSDSTEIPKLRWFLLALVPIAIDGISQTILGMRESTNTMRAITGFIAGFALPFFAVPLLNLFFKKK